MQFKWKARKLTARVCKSLQKISSPSHSPTHATPASTHFGNTPLLFSEEEEEEGRRSTLASASNV